MNRVRDLEERLADEILRSGPLSFARYMEAALYDPSDGFYARPAAGWNGHFLTSPHVSPVFAELLGLQIEDAWKIFGQPSPFLVVDAGAGDGVLLRELWETLRDGPAHEAIALIGVERGPGGRRAIEDAGLEAVPDLSHLKGGEALFLVANELLDNLPFHRLRQGPHGPREVGVGFVDGALVETEIPASAEALSALRRPLAEGQEQLVCPEMRRTIGQIARLLDPGYAILFDYGANGPATEVRCYRAHRTDGVPLQLAGLQDITADVDFAAAAEDARALGLTVWGPVSQRDALIALGYKRALRSLRAQQWDLERVSRWRQALRVFSERQSASLLIDPSGLGALRVLALASKDAPAPRLVQETSWPEGAPQVRDVP